MYVNKGFRENIEGRFEREVKSIMKNAFTSNNFFALSETAKYRPSEDEAVWQEKHGMREEYVEIYYKGEWVCDVHSNMTRDEMVRKVWRILQMRFLKEGEKNATSNAATS